MLAKASASSDEPAISIQLITEIELQLVAINVPAVKEVSSAAPMIDQPLMTAGNDASATAARHRCRPAQHPREDQGAPTNVALESEAAEPTRA